MLVKGATGVDELKEYDNLSTSLSLLHAGWNQSHSFTDWESLSIYISIQTIDTTVYNTNP